jgi:hypothetical protein
MRYNSSPFKWRHYAPDALLLSFSSFRAGFMRSTLGRGVVNGVNLDMLPLCNEVGQYYMHEPSNQYAAAIHKHSILGKAYAYGYDDVCEQSSVGITKNPTKSVLTVHPVSV